MGPAAAVDRVGPGGRAVLEDQEAQEDQAGPGGRRGQDIQADQEAVVAAQAAQSGAADIIRTDLPG